MHFVTNFIALITDYGVSLKYQQSSKMKKLLVILFLINLYALKNIFDIITGKYGQTQLKNARNMERIRIKIAKVKSDLKFLLTCKRNNLRPIFARPKISIKMNMKIRLS